MEPITDPQSLAETMAATPEERLAATAVAAGSGLAAVGDRIGRYVVLGPLGEGGMGVVVAAYDPELDRKVAIKILLPSRSPRARAHERLLREAQALARLSHPNVVAVHDVGTHDGRVFIAMEFIAGATLSATLGARRHSVAEVVGLYRMAGEGLAAAHRAGLVHRDFKPENVMVDGSGRAKVVDFGLAQAAAEAHDEVEVDNDGEVEATTSVRVASRLTATGALMGTPAYMAPEQHRGAATDARTDIFALCVALYEHLYGERPFAGETLATVAVAVLSGRVREAPRGARVSPRLRRVLLRGLSSRPDDRHPNMEALLADLERALAAPGRRRALIAAFGVALVAAGVIASLALRDPAARCRGGAAAIAEVWSPEAKAAGARAFAASGLPYADDAWRRVVAEIDGWADRWAGARDEACVAARVRGEHSEALLDRQGVCFERQRAYLGGLVDTLATADATVVERVGDVVASLPAASECGAAPVLGAGDGPAPPPADQRDAVDTVQRRLAGAVARFTATFAEADLAAVDALVDEARALGYLPLVAEALGEAGEGHLHLGDIDGGEVRLLEALTVAEAVGDTRRIAELWPKWIQLLVQGRSAFAEAEHADRRGEALLERIGGNERLRFELLHVGAVARNTKGDHQGAIDRAREALALGASIYGADAFQLAEVHNNLGGFLTHVDVDAAAGHSQRALEIWEKHLGPAHPKLAFAYFTLARDAVERNEYDLADRLYREARGRFERLNPDHPNIAVLTSALAQVLLYRGEVAQALAEYRAALVRLREVQGDMHTVTAQALLNIGNTALRAGHLEEARRAYDEALVIRRQLFGEESVKAAEVELLEVELLVDEGRPSRASAQAATVLAKVERLGEAGGQLGGRALAIAAMAVLADGRPREAIDLAERALELLRADSLHDYERAEVRVTLARALIAVGGDRARVRELVRAARESWRHWPGYYATELARLEQFVAEVELDAPAPRGRPR